MIPASSFVQGLNTLQFEEINTYSTEFEWTLYIDQGGTPDEYTTSFTYDTYGNITSVTDALGSTTYYQYDSNHIYLASITNALNYTISATHNSATGLLTSITDANGNTSSFEYDILGRVNKKINPDLTELEAVYDDQNNTTTIYDELDHYVIQYYDGLNRLIQTDVYMTPTTCLTETYTCNYLDKIVTKTDPGGHTYVYEYDSQGRPTRTTNPDTTFRQIHYSDATNTVSLFDENQHKREYHCDWTGNLLWVKEYTDAVNYYLTEYIYDAMGNLISLTDANDNITLYEYDSLFGVTQVTYPDLTTETFSYDAVGNVLQRTDENSLDSVFRNPLYFS